MNAFFTGIVGAFVEAAQELRIHRTRVLLSLVGVAVAVCALTVVVGAGAIAQQATVEISERFGGRPASLALQVNMADGTQPPKEMMDKAWADALDRYAISYASRNTQASQNVQFVDGVSMVQVQAVDPEFGPMRRILLDDGVWFADDDAQRLAPALVVNEVFWQRLGAPALNTNPTVTLLGADQNALGVVIGVYPTNMWDTEPAMYMLYDGYVALADTEAQANLWTEYSLWVPPEIAEELRVSLESDFSGALGEGATATVYRSDIGAQGQEDPFLAVKLVIGGIAGLVLVLGALGLVNISLVTLKQRIREIGVRRSFGATSGRIFFAVMMESVVGTIVAGAVGVVAAILIVRSPWLIEVLGQGMLTDLPPFPIEAAIIGMVAATAVGALAGLLPALVAVRVKVIDAIRF
ncbi:ABC transporter permease [Homoserinimonas sp. OAct 916]|uniref:ABC transporter permease n=1 Tax=Homoserinimonas sp. OAct 916 TaxID=2211450 RepID=UPI000DBE9723|nr:ABC transporter permease [Homoserinimonas sp. OAct 916]